MQYVARCCPRETQWATMMLHCSSFPTYINVYCAPQRVVVLGRDPLEPSVGCIKCNQERTVPNKVDCLAIRRQHRAGVDGMPANILALGVAGRTAQDLGDILRSKRPNNTLLVGAFRKRRRHRKSARQQKQRAAGYRIEGSLMVCFAPLRRRR